MTLPVSPLDVLKAKWNGAYLRGLKWGVVYVL